MLRDMLQDTISAHNIKPFLKQYSETQMQSETENSNAIRHDNCSQRARSIHARVQDLTHEEYST